MYLSTSEKGKIIKGEYINEVVIKDGKLRVFKHPLVKLKNQEKGCIYYRNPDKYTKGITDDSFYSFVFQQNYFNNPEDYNDFDEEVSEDIKNTAFTDFMGLDEEVLKKEWNKKINELSVLKDSVYTESKDYLGLSVIEIFERIKETYPKVSDVSFKIRTNLGLKLEFSVCDKKDNSYNNWFTGWVSEDEYYNLSGTIPSELKNKLEETDWQQQSIELLCTLEEFVELIEVAGGIDYSNSKASFDAKGDTTEKIKDEIIENLNKKDYSEDESTDDMMDEFLALDFLFNGRVFSNTLYFLDEIIDDKKYIYTLSKMDENLCIIGYEITSEIENFYICDKRKFSKESMYDVTKINAILPEDMDLRDFQPYFYGTDIQKLRDEYFGSYTKYLFE